MKYSALLGLTSLAAVTAHPHQRQPQASSPSTALQKRALDIEKFALPSVSSYEKHDPAGSTASISSTTDYVETATQLVKKQYPKLEFRVVDDHYVGSNGVGHVHFKQTVHGIDVDNADFNVNIGRDGNVFSHGDSFYTGNLPENPPTQKRDTNEAITALKKAVELLNLPVEVPADAEALPNFVDSNSYLISGTSGTEKNPETRLVYFRKGDDSELTLSWRVETDVVDNWLLTYVDASKHEILGALDYVSDFATYQVYPWNVNDPSRGQRVIEKEPWLLSASPLTWIGDGSTNYTTTRGNNAIAQVNPTGGNSYLNNYRPNQAQLKFEYSYSLTETDPTKYKDASITQLFFTANKYHDLSYVLGFTEKAGNFQVNNNNKGGKGSDFVILNAQDGSGTNNANFASPPDGQPGRMRMYIWDRQTPKRDCSFDAGVIIHEYTHGISNRLTGGPSNSGCLGTTIAGGMGEGWSDIFAIAIGIQPGDTRKVDRPMGPWISNNAAGIRAYPYSTSLNVNPQTYKNVIGAANVHSIGAIWANMLFEVLWNIIDKHGKNDADFPKLNSNGVPDDGKFLTLKIIQDALALQPCSPDFVSARDAILDADVVLTGGANKCQIWAGFSKRGLGPKATAKTITEDFSLPAGCQ